MSPHVQLNKDKYKVTETKQQFAERFKKGQEGLFSVGLFQYTLLGSRTIHITEVIIRTL